ncbi:M36 family metallopeptidase [Parvularcula maris]|uniref:Extracellular metalloproteinase n=1 Tax=Parvularcula maris TaxID=2965077 RepID=A0A9X2L6Q9_9PROT|nr:M36 family metallopeptidase [Parvularcula maris]MCQ8184159.1 extracellular metalloproteinase [Parvularcula maris]
MNLQKRLLSGAAILAVSTAAAHAQEQDILLDTKPTVVTAEELNASSLRGSRAERVRGALRKRGDIGQDAELVLVREHRDGKGRVHQRFEQVVDGRRVYGASVTANFGEDGDLKKLRNRLRDRRNGKARRAGISAVDALEIARQRHFPAAPDVSAASTEGFVTTFAENDFYYQAPEVEEVVIARRGRNVIGYEVKLWSADSNELFHTLIGPNGRVLNVEDRTSRDQYAIFPDHPGNSNQVVVNGPGSGNAQSPNGWLFSGTQYRNYIRGNNVSAYLDRNNNNAPDTSSGAVTNGVFTTAASLNQDPSTTSNQYVAIQNLFYLNNRIHDILYTHGFTESAGNFQENNFGKGGFGSDSVNAEAQDGGGFNNANFATPGDGSNPRMQMYIWNLTNPYRDGDLDSDIVYHEYGHGLTWRMIGNMSGSISGAIGEGMADVLSILINNDDRVGEYSAANPNGIRSARYTNYPKDIGDFTGTSVHRDGEIYAATIWRLKALYEANGYTADQLMGDLVDGMNFTAPGPDYMDMRDGILDAVGGAKDCLVWEAFAEFGMGVGSSMGSRSASPSYALPSTCGGGGGGGNTDTTPPDLSNFGARRLSSCRFRLTWNSNEPATSQVRFPDYNYTYSDNTLKTSHSVTFNGSCGTTYSFYFEGQDAAGNLASEGPYSYRR